MHVLIRGGQVTQINLSRAGQRLAVGHQADGLLRGTLEHSRTSTGSVTAPLIPSFVFPSCSSLSFLHFLTSLLPTRTLLSSFYS